MWIYGEPYAHGRPGDHRQQQAARLCIRGFTGVCSGFGRPARRLLAAVAGMTAVHVMDSVHTRGSTIGRMRMGAQDSIASSQAYRGKISGTVLDLAQARLPEALARGSLFRSCMWRTGARSLD